MPNATQDQGDLFAPPREKPARVGHKARRIAASSLAALEARRTTTEPRVRGIVLTEIKSAGYLARTRQEIADRTKIPLQSVCSSVVALIRSGDVFEPIRDWTPEGRPIHHQRDGRHLVCAKLYESTWQPRPR